MHDMKGNNLNASDFT